MHVHGWNNAHLDQGEGKEGKRKEKKRKEIV